jgi:hypothetical protein
MHQEYLHHLQPAAANDVSTPDYGQNARRAVNICLSIVNYKSLYHAKPNRTEGARSVADGGGAPIGDKQEWCEKSHVYPEGLYSDLHTPKML